MGQDGIPVSVGIIIAGAIVGVMIFAGLVVAAILPI